LQKIDIETLKPPPCPEELLDLKHNSTYVTQLCFRKDVFYNMEIMVGEDNHVFEMAIDLTSPWTWLKSSSCKLCPKIDPLEFEEGDSCKSPRSCTNAEFNQTFDSGKW